jgi:uncharacterized membrane protein YtjA (UPF0391 family)
MLRWTLIFLVFSLVAGALGFYGLAAGAASIAQILFYLFPILFIFSLLFGAMGGGRPRIPPPL